MTFQLLRAKLKRPTPSGRVRHLPRKRIMDLLDTARDYKVVLISAPAGYGKTVVLSQWAQRNDDRTAWISLDISEEALTGTGHDQHHGANLGQALNIIIGAVYLEWHRLEDALPCLIQAVTSLRGSTEVGIVAHGLIRLALAQIAMNCQAPEVKSTLSELEVLGRYHHRIAPLADAVRKKISMQLGNYPMSLSHREIAQLRDATDQLTAHDPLPHPPVNRQTAVINTYRTPQPEGRTGPATDRPGALQPRDIRKSAHLFKHRQNPHRQYIRQIGRQQADAGPFQSSRNRPFVDDNSPKKEILPILSDVELY